jgi:hypothetical protein
VTTGGAVSTNAEKKVGRDDGFGPGLQRGTGHRQEAGPLVTGPNPTKGVRPFRRSPSNRGEDIARGTVPETTRTDLVHELGEE